MSAGDDIPSEINRGRLQEAERQVSLVCRAALAIRLEAVRALADLLARQDALGPYADPTAWLHGGVREITEYGMASVRAFIAFRQALAEAEANVGPEARVRIQQTLVRQEREGGSGDG